MVIDPKNATQTTLKPCFSHNECSRIVFTTPQVVSNFSTWKNVLLIEMCTAGSREPSPRPRTRYREGAQIFLLGIGETCEVLAYRLKTDLFFLTFFVSGFRGGSWYHSLYFYIVDACFRLSMVLRCRIFVDRVFGVGRNILRFIFSSMKLPIPGHGVSHAVGLWLAKLAISFVYELEELHPCARTASKTRRFATAMVGTHTSKWPKAAIPQQLRSKSANLCKSEKRLNWKKAFRDMFAVSDPKNWWPFDGQLLAKMAKM